MHDHLMLTGVKEEEKKKKRNSLCSVSTDESEAASFSEAS